MCVVVVVVLKFLIAVAKSIRIHNGRQLAVSNFLDLLEVLGTLGSLGKVFCPRIKGIDPVYLV